MNETWGQDEKGRLFYGYCPRECGEHRTVGAHRAWCYDCAEWCYPGETEFDMLNSFACRGCTAAIARARRSAQ